MRYRINGLYLLSCVLIMSFSSICHAQSDSYSELPDGAIRRLGKGRFMVMKFSPDGKHLAVGTAIGVWLYDTNTQNVIGLKPTQPRQVDNREFKSNNNTDTWNPSDVSIVNHLSFSSDSQILATCELANWIIQLWDVDTGEQLKTLPLTRKGDSVLAIAFSDDNKTLIAPNYFGEIIHWDVTTGNLVNHIENFRSDLTHIEEKYKAVYHIGGILVFSNDSKTFVSGNRMDGQIRLWDAFTGQQLGVFEPGTRFNGNSNHEPEPLKGINLLAISPNGKNIVYGFDDNTIRIYDIVTKTEIAVLNGHQARINTITFSPDSSKLVSGSLDKTVRFWDVNKKKEISKLTGFPSHIVKLSYSPDGKIIASAGNDGNIRFLDPNSGRELKIFTTGHNSSRVGLAFTKDNKMLVSAANNGSVHIWDVENGTPLQTPNIEHYDRTEAIAFSTDATLYASQGADTVYQAMGSKTRVRWSPHSETHLWSLPHGENIISLPHSYSGLTFSPDNRLLAASNFKTTSLWDIQKRQELFRIDVKQFYTDVVVRFSPDGKSFTTGGINGEVHIWDVKYGDKIGTLSSELPEYSKDLAYSPDNSILAVSYDKDQLKLWNLKTKKEMHTLLTPQDKVKIERIVFSPDSKTLMVIIPIYRNRGEIRLFHVESGMQLPPIRTGHTLGIRTLVFSHDQKTLATGAADGTILLWDWEKITKKISIEN